LKTERRSSEYRETGRPYPKDISIRHCARHLF
jgi:hypothetical protein